MGPHGIPMGSQWVTMRLKVVAVPRKVSERWVAKYSSLSSSSSSSVLKRPASAAQHQPVAKRSTSSSSSPVLLTGACGVEAVIGQRYREQVTDLGLGVQKREMRQRLLEWGYDVSEQACRTWLQRYCPMGPMGSYHYSIILSGPRAIMFWQPRRDYA